MSSHPQLSVSPNHHVPFEVVFECEDYLVINKPTGVITQPHHQGKGSSSTELKQKRGGDNTLLNGLFSRWGHQLQNLGKKRDFGLLHRLDRGTSGLVLVGLSARGYDELRAQFEARALSKEYWAILNGRPHPALGQLSWPIKEERVASGKRAIVLRSPASSPAQRGGLKGGQREAQREAQRGAQPALTLYKELSTGRLPTPLNAEVSLVACRIETGRLHQIRAHMSALGCPVIGDFDYGGASELNRYARALERDALALHAVRLTIQCPHTQRRRSFIAPPSPLFKRLAQEASLSLNARP